MTKKIEAYIIAIELLRASRQKLCTVGEHDVADTIHGTLEVCTRRLLELRKQNAR
jgi:hypothetical protein